MNYYGEHMVYVRLRNTTRDRLKAAMPESSYDEAITKLIDHYEVSAA